jgi:plasmid stabilization system protein ParE
MPQALGDLDAIYAYIAQDDPAAAPAFRTSDPDRTLGRRADSLIKSKTQSPATDLGYFLATHPGRAQPSGSGGASFPRSIGLRHQR